MITGVWYNVVATDIQDAEDTLLSYLTLKGTQVSKSDVIRIERDPNIPIVSYNCKETIMVNFDASIRG